MSEPFEFPIERGKIREFATATLSRHEEYRGPDAVVPPTFLATSTFWDPPGNDLFAELGFDLRRLLHVGIEYVFHGAPPQAGDVLTAQSRIAERYEKEGKRGGTMKFAVLVTEFTDAGGAIVAEQRATLVETEKAPA